MKNDGKINFFERNVPKFVKVAKREELVMEVYLSLVGNVRNGVVLVDGVALRPLTKTWEQIAKNALNQVRLKF